ncbi:Gag-Pol polyprotein [Plakobranchus ocellatus]|uniref:Gag-Pol polyprotein n=1 Tax=Plakobranchus ocellatus TaxID=259542 RepID=A0AAV4A9P5_9GAST|nr:Gag-Pol polyprotein [Plakobranchus ocellatus]
MSQPQGESTQALLAALTSQLQSMTVQPNISAVSLKLPEFWTTSPEVWFARVEAQFGTKNISTDQTKYDYVVSALDVKTAEEISASASPWIQSPINTSCVLLSPQIWPTSSSLPTWVQIFVLAAFGKRQCQPLSVAAAGNPHQPNTFSVVDRLSGRSYLVDTGAEVSVYPASVQERKSQPPSSTLTAANGTSIHTWGKRKVFLAIGQKGQYQHEFYLADVTRPILGADFFIKHGLAIDLRG